MWSYCASKFLVQNKRTVWVWRWFCRCRHMQTTSWHYFCFCLQQESFLRAGALPALLKLLRSSNRNCQVQHISKFIRLCICSMLMMPHWGRPVREANHSFHPWQLWSELSDRFSIETRVWCTVSWFILKYSRNDCPDTVEHWKSTVYCINASWLSME